MTPVHRFFKAEFGQDVIEYALLCTLVALTGVGLAVSIGLDVDTAYGRNQLEEQKGPWQRLR